MSVNYKEYQKNIGNNKFFKVLGWFFLIAGIFVFITHMIPFASWNSKKSNYSKEYVYSEFGTLYYEANGKKIYVQNIYNTYNEKITLDIPNNEIIVMYINKDNINEGIYFDLDNTTDQSMLDPTLSISASLFLVVMGLYFILTCKETKENESTTNPLFPFFVYLFLLGIGVVVFQSYNAINYINLKSQNNIATATIYSEIYNKGAEKREYHKPVAYYYVDGKKYIYVNDTYEEGTLDDKLGDTFELYYAKSNPNKVAKKEKPINILILIIGIGFAVFSFPFVFLKSKMNKGIQKNILKQSENGWKIWCE